MLIAIQPENIEGNSYAIKWTELLKSKGVDVKWVDLNARDALEQVRGCDGVMWRWTHEHRDKIKAYKILHTIEYYLGIPIYPNHATCWHYDDKVAQFYLLKAIEAPMPETWIFWNRKNALDWTERAKYPVVFKLSSGAGSSNVIKIDSKEQAQKYVRMMFDRGIFSLTMNEFKSSFSIRTAQDAKRLLSRIKHGMIYMACSTYPPLPKEWWIPEKGYIYLQEFLSGNDGDFRITITGNRARGFKRLNRDNDFRASGSGKFDIDPSKMNLEAVRIAFDTARKLKSQCIAFDFLLKEGTPVITEISYTFPDVRYALNLPGYWDSNLNWVPRRMWPQEAQVEDFIKYVSSFKNNKEKPCVES